MVAKNFKLVKGAEKVFYNIDRTIGHDYVVIVEGEMDALSFVESGIESVVSVPNGATINNTNLDYLDSCIDYFETKEKVILAVDADEAGLALKQELIRRLGAERCFTVDIRNGYKDANEFLMAHGRSMLADVIAKAKPVPIENVVTLKDINDELEDLFDEGFNLVIKSVLITLIAYSVLIQGNSSPLQECLALVSLILLIEWWWVTT
jgi:twinkle protein